MLNNIEHQVTFKFIIKIMSDLMSEYLFKRFKKNKHHEY